jgi:hypothetical protein
MAGRRFSLRRALFNAFTAGFYSAYGKTQLDPRIARPRIKEAWQLYIPKVAARLHIIRETVKRSAK